MDGKQDLKKKKKKKIDIKRFYQQRDSISPLKKIIKKRFCIRQYISAI